MNQQQNFSWDFSYILASFFPAACLQAPQEEADENSKKISGKKRHVNSEINSEGRRGLRLAF